MVFESAALRDKTAREFGAVEGLGQTLDRLGQLLAAADAGGVAPFVISRTFDAPRDRLFDLWTQRDHLMKWFGPKGWSMTYGKLDFRPGGLFHYSMRTADGAVMWGKFVYREIAPPERLVWVNSFSDENAGLTRHPGAPEWPIEMLTTVTFVEQDGRTTVTVHWVPINPTEVERQTFDGGRGSMTMGWTGTFDQLAAYVAKG
jgi:uncharacterized protein YndB with AHSA1/START domain